MRDNGHKLKQDEFRLEIKENLSPYGDSAAAVQVAQKCCAVSSFGVFQHRLHKALGHIV